MMKKYNEKNNDINNEIMKLRNYKNVKTMQKPFENRKKEDRIL